MTRSGLFGAALLMLGPPAVAQEAVRLSEPFEPGTRYRVRLRVDLDGRITVPTGEKMTPQTVPVRGTSSLIYDERVLPPDDATADKVVRAYREVEFRRTLGDRDQQAGVRPEVRRMVVLRSAQGKSPFSPDGPLLWAEIDVVKNDVFAPALVPALLPPRAVKPGDRWAAGPSAVVELTDMEKVDAGGFAVTFAGVATVNDRRHAKLAIAGTVTGVDEQGPCRHTLDGAAYFDLEQNRLAYLSLKGSHELIDPAGKATGRVDGRFVMERTAGGAAEDIADAKLAGVALSPTAENSALLYDNPELGVRFEYPRRWRVGAVQGRQVALDGPNGGGILLTVEPAARVPTAAAYKGEVEGFLKGQKAAVTNAGRPEPVANRPGVERFGLDADVEGEKVRMEYAVLKAEDGGATLAARLPRADAGVLAADVARVVRTLAVTKPIR